MRFSTAREAELRLSMYSRLYRLTKEFRNPALRSNAERRYADR
jgi:hypothetical protein